MTATVTPQTMADAIRVLAMDAVERANSGHPGMPMGMADVATVLWTRFLKYDPADPAWPDRDRFVLSAGHGSMLIYSLLYLSGVPGIGVDDLKNFRQLRSNTPGHPEYGETPGVETTTGPLGQGLATAVGMALAERLMNARFGDALVDHRTWVIASDGDLMEGISHEAISIAGHLRLNRLTVLFDDNHITIDGPLSLSESGDMRKRFEAAGWATDAVDGHDMAAVAAALERAKTSDRPTLIACRTLIGKGAPNKCNTSDCHGSALGKEEVAATRAALGWPHAEFDMPDDVLTAWRGASASSKAAHREWTERFAHASQRAEFEAAIKGALPKGWRDAIRAHARKMAETAPAMATRQSSGAALEALVPAIPQLIGGSADLTGSNNTKVKGMQNVTAGDYSGRYVNYGVREHGMAAAMNGMALHGGIIPYAGTFLAFADYCRPAIRLAALMHQRVIHVMTHDSIGLGEDGPTHQPVEHLASLRAMPNVLVFRPADAVEAAECWEAALDHARGPSVMALSRQKLPALRKTASDENLSARGAYVLKSGANGVEEQIVLLATGSETHIAMKAAELLAADGIGARVVSMPCWELFEAQDQAYRDEVLPAALPRVAVEAAVRFGWDRWLGGRNAFVGMKGFGASAPAEQLYAHFGITAEAVADAAKGLL
jgi:transketolase